MPPPPALDLTSRGYPMLSHLFFKSSLLSFVILEIPGHIGILDLSASSRAISLLPIDLIKFGFGPIQTIFLSITC